MWLCSYPVRSYLWLIRTLERDRENCTTILNNLDHKIALLLMGKLIPVGNSLSENTHQPLRSLTRSFNTGQVKASRVLDATVTVTDEEGILRHGWQEY
jgi:hypothetical protein